MVFIKKVIDKPLGQILIEMGILTSKQLQEALEFQKKEKMPIGEILISLGFLKEEDIVYALSLQYGFPYLPLDNYDVDKEVIAQIPLELCLKYEIIPVDIIGKTLTVATPNPLNIENFKKLEEETGFNVQIFICTKTEYQNALEKYYKK